MSAIVPINPFVILGRMDARLDQVLALALRGDDEDLLYHVEMLKTLRDELRAALMAQQRETTVRQFEDSIAMLRKAKAEPSSGLDFLE